MKAQDKIDFIESQISEIKSGLSTDDIVAICDSYTEMVLGRVLKEIHSSSIFDSSRDHTEIIIVDDVELIIDNILNDE